MLWEPAHGFPWLQSPNYNFLLILNKVYLLEKYLAGGSDCKESTLNAGDLGRKDPLEKGMATHSSILLWRIPWAEEPGRPQSMGHKESDMTYTAEQVGCSRRGNLNDVDIT